MADQSVASKYTTSGEIFQIFS